jgi:hypothetical protein
MGLLNVHRLFWIPDRPRAELPSCVEQLPLRCPCRHRRICSALLGGGGLMYEHLGLE